MTDVTELVINRPGEVLYEQGPVWQRASIPELTLDRLNALTRAIATCSEQEISPRHPILSATLPDGQRVQIIVPPAVEAGQISLTIRLPGSTIRTLEDYQSEGAFDRFRWAVPETDGGRLSPAERELLSLLSSRDLKGFLLAAVGARCNLAIVGDTGSGKTTLMKTVCQHIPVEDRIVTIEDVREIDLPAHQNKVHLLYSRGGQGTARVTPGDLIASNMRMRPDRVLLAELRGSEAFDYLKLLTTGHSGSVTSYHAESCALAVERYVLMAREHPDAAIFDAGGLRRLVSLTLDVIVHMRSQVVRRADGSLSKTRYVAEVYYNPIAKHRAPFEHQPLTRGASE
ncbi:P-type DNA transfer ATPase VirB11 [Asticcacaulis sp. W401b]|uniref:P-type DNA transfer ATPase VirB11 n=1 Tax=Asticcacaulis sp. W401b TaxID=3388666 RepID=UPI003970ADA9